MVPRPAPTPPPRPVGDPTIRRLSLYLAALDAEAAAGRETIASSRLAALAGTTPAQVRKDLSHFGSFGVRGSGYGIAMLGASLREILGLGREQRVVIVGAGKIGAALAQYPGFGERGFRLVAVFDQDPAKIGTRWGPLRVLPMERLAAEVKRHGAKIAVLAVPAEAAGHALAALARAGIRAVLNFAPGPLSAPAGVTVHSVNMAAELESLSFALTQGPPADRPRSRGTGGARSRRTGRS